MNITQNIVKIRTATQMGTGIIYPCECDPRNPGSYNYVIFTNRHLVKDIVISEKDILKCLRFDIYDKRGKKIDCSPSRKDVMLKLFCPEIIEKDLNENLEDIAVFLLTFTDAIDLNLETRIVWEDISLNYILMEGFPKILSSNDISSKLRVRGVYKPVFPPNDKVGVFQIIDDYHWYNSYMDYHLFQGFSGSPIFQIEADGKYGLIGMNQSISNIDSGENPFKLMYYYKMPYILEYLRECGCILFSREADGSARIRWIYDKEEYKQTSVSQEQTLLLLGASGAGKSSFAKSFLLHSKYINSTNDGQTTRTNIIYKLNKFEKEPKVKITFFDRNKFLNHMDIINYENYLYRLCCLIFQKYDKQAYQGNSIEEYVRYFCYSYSEQMQKEDNNSKITELKNNINKLFYQKDDMQKQNERAELKYRYYIDMLEKLCEDMLEILIRYNENNWNSDFIFRKSEVFIEHQEEIRNTLQSVNGFFDIHEFDFLEGEDKKINVTLDEETDEKGSDFIKGYFEKFYKKIHTELINRIKKRYPIRDNNYTIEERLDTLVDSGNLLTYSLQKKGKYSLTGMVDLVCISDSVSNDYAFIFDELGIEHLRLIDTCGLDHSHWNAKNNLMLMNTVFELNENNIIEFGPELAVLYIKKLDSGKPTELNDIIPDIFELLPMAPIYCVFTGIDIYLGSDIENFYDAESYFKLNRCPKAYAYIKDNDSLPNMHKLKNNGNINNLYSTMRNNLVTYCANENIIKNYFNIFDNNRNVIYQLLTSIAMNEYASMSIIPDNVINSIKNGNHKEAIEKFLKNVFEEASIKNWEWFHWKTRKANFSRILYADKLGYWGMYMQQWNQLFYIGYGNAIRNKGIDILELGDENAIHNKNTNILGSSSETKSEIITAVDACIRNMESEFFGKPNDLIKFKTEDSGEFRKFLEEMYEANNYYTFNPFNDKEHLDKKDLHEKYGTEKESELTKKILSDICDFSKGISKIQEELYEWFIKCLVNEIRKENEKKAQNMIKINRGFFKQFMDAKYQFEEKYKSSELKFEVLLQAYLYDKEK